MPLRTSIFCLLLLLSVSALSQDPFGGSDPFGSQATGSQATGSQATGSQAIGGDPFGTGNSPAVSDPGFGVFGRDVAPTETIGVGPIADAVQQDADPVVRLLRAAPPKTPTDMADGLTWMSRIKRWDEVRRLLDVVQASNWDQTQKAILARAAGAALWIRLRSGEAELTDEQKQLVKDISAAPAKLSRDPQWIDQWIDKLASPAAGERRLAQLRLQDGSSVAIQRLVQRLLDGDTRVTPLMLAGTAREFGADGVDALRAACLVQETDKSSRVFLALADLPGKDFAAELGAGLASRVLPADAQAKLAEIIASKYTSLPTDASIHAYLEKRFQEAIDEYQQARSHSSKLHDSVWRPTADRGSVEFADTAPAGRELERVAQLAALRLQLRTATRRENVDNGTLLMQRAYQMEPELSSNEIAAQLLVDFPEELRTDDAYWQSVFARAGELQMHGAALRSLQAMVESASRVAPPLGFLGGLLKDPRPMIRYSALAAIAELNPTEAYANAETAIETALEMTRLSNGPHSLVIGLQSELRQVAQQQLQLQSNGDVTAVNSARAALLALDAVQPIELIVVVDRVADQSIYQLLQRLRNTKKGNSLPIAVLTDELYVHERRLIAEMPGVLASALSRDKDQMKRVVDQLVEMLDTQPMSTEDRARFAMAGAEFLTRVAGDRDLYSFYPIGDWREHLVSTAGALSGASQVQLLAGLGSGDSQRQLVRSAAGSAGSEADRLDAASGFGKSVRRFGIQLGDSEVRDFYALYNQLGPSDPVARKTLGYVLDVIEAQSGRAGWPEGL